MQLKYTQLLTALRLSQRFLDEHAAVLHGVANGGARKVLDEVAGQLAVLGAQQDAHRGRGRGALATELTLAAALRRQWLKPIVRIAKSKRVDWPQFVDVVLPGASDNTTAIVTKAHGIADIVAPFQQLFIDRGMPADFLPRMLHDADALLHVVSNKGDSRKSRVGTTDGIGKVAKSARHALGVLDTLVRAQLHGAEPLVTAWRDASRVISNKTRTAKSPVALVPAVPVAAATEPARTPTEVTAKAA